MVRAKPERLRQTQRDRTVSRGIAAHRFVRERRRSQVESQRQSPVPARPDARWRFFPKNLSDPTMEDRHREQKARAQVGMRIFLLPPETARLRRNVSARIFL